MTEAFPLHWPPGWPRTKRPETARFQTRFRVARDGLLDELRLMGAKHVVISSNLELRRDDLPYANQRRPSDCGIAVYFLLDGRQQCIPCDRWTLPEDNLQAIRKTVEALRGLDRWGAKSMVDAAFRGFEALPPPSESKPWWEVLGTERTANAADVERAWRRKARDHHPDHGGTDAQMAEINAARDAAMREAQP